MVAYQRPFKVRALGYPLAGDAFRRRPRRILSLQRFQEGCERVERRWVGADPRLAAPPGVIVERSRGIAPVEQARGEVGRLVEPRPGWIVRGKRLQQASGSQARRALF